MGYTFARRIDWLLLVLVLPLVGAGLVTMKTLGSGSDYFFLNQLTWLAVSLGVFTLFSVLDWSFLRRSTVLVVFYGVGIGMLFFLLGRAVAIRGAASWISFAGITIEPSDPMKLALILILAKYFSRRHVEIARPRHIVISGLYAAVPMFLVLLQPDFGSAMIIGALWLGMILVSGVKKRQLLVILLIGAVLFALAWGFFLEPYQKQRIRTFLDPLTDPQGAGYNALQAVVAAGSGQLFGKGVGFGAQSRLGFLPEHETDFIFAAFAEEWGLIGVTILFLLFGFLLARILSYALRGKDNFERLFAVGVAVLIAAHVVIHTGMNIGLLPITGIALPFLSYGGSGLVTLFAALGILASFGQEQTIFSRREAWEKNA